MCSSKRVVSHITILLLCLPLVAGFLLYLTPIKSEAEETELLICNCREEVYEGNGEDVEYCVFKIICEGVPGDVILQSTAPNLEEYKSSVGERVGGYKFTYTYVFGNKKLYYYFK